MKLTFLGAAREVTGSCTLIEAGGHRFLVDCGMEQGKDVYPNADLPCAPGEIEAILLTHAHIDHSGRIPYLYKNGFRGPIYSTDATMDLCEIMLEDSAHIQEQEAEWKNRKAMRSGAEMIEPDYTALQASQARPALRARTPLSLRDISPRSGESPFDKGASLSPLRGFGGTPEFKVEEGAGALRTKSNTAFV